MFLEAFLFFCLLFVFFYWHCTKQFNFFKIRGIPYAQPSFPFGSRNTQEMMNGKINFFEIDKMLVESEEFKDKKVFGYFMMGQPNFLVNDEEMAKKIMISDFDHFTDLRPTGYKGHTKENKLFNSMFTTLGGEDWRKTRAIFNPAFTGSKLKIMTPHLVKVGVQLSSFVKEHTGEEFEARDLFGKFSIDGLATAGFGIEIDSFKDPDSIFRNMALTLAGAPGYGSSWDIPRFILLTVAPKLAKLFKVPVFNEKASLFLASIIEKTLQHRRKSGYRRNDLVDIAMDELKGKLAEELTDEEKEFLLVGNLLVLFFAGFDTIAITLGQVVHGLMFNQDIQEKVFKEIEEVFIEESDEITWDRAQKCVYMDMVIQESMRYYNLVRVTERICTKDYKIPNTDITIPKGRMVKIYFDDMMKNENNFKNVNEFYPENFHPDNKPNKFAFQAFGQGPRGCIGYRYAMVNMKIALISLLRQHKVMPCDKTNRGPLVLDPAQLLAIKGGIWFKTEERY